MNNDLVSVVIPTYNRKDKLERLLLSIQKSSYDAIEIIVVDDASTDQTYSYLAQKFPEVRIIRHEKERFVSASRNTGIRASNGKYIFLVDDDNVVATNTIHLMVDFMNSHLDVGVCAPVMLYYSDPEIIWCAGVRRNRFTTKTTYLFSGTRYTENLPTMIESEDFPNAFMLRRDVIDKIGYFDEERFPINYEEGDLCKRAERVGYRITTCVAAKVWHDIPSPRKEDGNVVARLRILNSKRTYYYSYNRILFHKLYNTNLEFAIFLIVLPLFSLHTMYSIYRSGGSAALKLRAMNAHIRGIADSMMGKKHSWNE